MQYSDIPTIGIWFEPIFCEECEISQRDYKDLQEHIFSKISIFSQERIKPEVSPECQMTFVPALLTTYVFRITDFKKKDRKPVLEILHYKLPFASKKLLSNEQHVYEIKIEVHQKARGLYHLCLTVQTETQVKNQKKLDKIEQAAELLRTKTKEDKKFLALVARAKAQNTRYVLKKLETQPYLVGNLRDWNSSSKAAS